MPDQKPTEPTLGERLTTALDAAATGSDTDVSPTKESAGAATSPEGKRDNVDAILAQLPPADREMVQRMIRGVQSKADKMEALVKKYDGLDAQDLATLRALYTDPDLVAKFRKVASDHSAGRSGTRAEVAAERALTKEVNAVFEELISDPAIDGPQRASLIRLRTAVKQEAEAALADYAKRLDTVERVLVSQSARTRQESLAAMQAEVGEELFDRYVDQARRRVEQGMTPQEAFQSVMSAEDLVAWLRPRQQKTLDRKKQVSEVTSPANGEGGAFTPVPAHDMAKVSSARESLIARNIHKVFGR